MKLVTMVPLVSFLAALRILTEAQICNNGEGKIVYEKILLNNHVNQLPEVDLLINNNNLNNISSHELIVRDGLPLKVLDECFRRCQEDRLNTILNCAKFDFIPGKRLSDPHIEKTANVKGSSVPRQIKAQYDQSKCVLYSDLTTNTNLSEILPEYESNWHFNEICLPAQIINRNCPNRFYVFEKISGFQLSNENTKTINVTDKTECESKCLMERTFACRSASYDIRSNRCYLSQFNRHMLPGDFKPNANYEYMENMCLKHNEMCKWNTFIIETGKQFDSIYEKLLVSANTASICSNICLGSLDKYGFICRSFVYDEENQTCILYDEDPLEPFTETNAKLVPSKGNLYRVLCSTDEKDKYLDNKTLECYRHKRLRGRHQSELPAVNFYQCLSACFRQNGRNCRSIEFSHQKNVCRFSDRSVVGPLSSHDNEALVDDDSFDYYQFMWTEESESQQNKQYSFDPMKDRHDSIEVSNSHPSIYGNFLSPAEQNRDHHRGGFTYTVSNYPQKSPHYQYSQTTPRQQLDHVRPIQNDRGTSTQIDYQRLTQNIPSEGTQVSQFDHRRPINDNHNEQSKSSELGPQFPNQPALGQPSTVRLQRPDQSERGQSLAVEFQRPLKPYSSNNINSYNYNYQNSMARTPMVSGPISVNNRFMPYGVPPYTSFNSVSQPNYPPLSQVSIKAGAIPTPVTTQIAYDRYGHVTQTRPENGIQSAGCKYDPIIQESSKFRRVGFSSRLKSKHIYKVVRAERLEDCEKYCVETKDFICKSFNFRAFFPDNCELSSTDTKKYKPEDTSHFEHNTQFDYYERVEHKALIASNSMDCFEVLQTCSPEGMELKLKTTEGFFGRIYTYGFYDSCFFDGNGGTSNVLRISKPNGFPRCGTQQVGDAMTNIVVVQFNDYVQTSRDKKYNLTCFISGPGEAVVTSNYLDTKTDGRHPMQIEHLPAQNILTSNIALRVLYRGTPTNTIVVGDLLTFRLEARNQYRYNGYHNDIFATNVIAKDPYTGRQVLLIDSRGCPVDLFVFPELHKTPDGALEAEFYAFKIPDSNFLVFQATVKTCKGQCEPVICTDKGRGQGSFPSSGRRRRSIPNPAFKPKLGKHPRKNTTKTDEEEVHEMLQVYLSYEDVPESKRIEKASLTKMGDDRMCLDRFAFYTLISLATLFVIIVIVLLPYCGLVKIVKYRYKNKQNHLTPWYNIKWPSQASSSYPVQPTFTAFPRLTLAQTKPNQGPGGNQQNLSTEPIYSNSSILERSRSLQSLTVQNANRVIT